MYLDICARVCRQKLWLKSLGAWFVTAVWRENNLTIFSRYHRVFTQHSSFGYIHLFTIYTYIHKLYTNHIKFWEYHVSVLRHFQRSHVRLMRSCLLLKKRHALREAPSQECMISSLKSLDSPSPSSGCCPDLSLSPSPV